MVPAWGRSSSNRGMGCSSSLYRTHGRTALGSSKGGGGSGRGGAAAVARPGLDPPVGGGEELRTRGLKLCPLLVFTMDRLEKERMGWLGMKMKGGGEGGRGGWI